MTGIDTGESLLADGVIGGRIGRYRLIGLLATGGMAQVYLALSGELSGFRTLVVVKRILPHLASNTQFIQMFFDEARIVARLDHPNIVRITEVGHDNEQYFLAMEVVQGRPLSAVLRRAVKQQTPLTHAQAAFIVAQAADGLGYAHNLCDADGLPLNIVHRDVSPQNILVSFEGAVKVIDFGVAHATGKISETKPGGLKGKIHYMAPEQASAGHADRRSDVFALGVVLWEALCGRRLFRRDSELEIMRAIINDPVLPPSKLVRISPHLERIVMRALEKEPMNRFQDAEEMALALERFAFATGGFSPLQVATTMKTLFASDYTRWKRTVAAAMDQEGSPEQWSNAAGTLLRPRALDDGADRPTLALPPGTPHESGAQASSTDHPRGDSRSISSSAFVPRDFRGRLRRRAMASGALVLGIGIALSLFVLSLPPSTINVIRPAVSDTPSMNIVPLPRTALGAPAVAADAPVPPTTNGGGVAPAFQAEPSLTATTATGTTPAIEPESTTTTSSTGLSTRRIRPQRHAHVRRTSAGRKSGRATVETGTPPQPSVEASTACRITVGTTPWSEVWIDGRNTRAHTPYSAAIDCGEHKLAFKRTDLGVTKKMTVAVRSGEPFKLSFALDED